MDREAASLTCRVRPLEVGQNRHISPDWIPLSRWAGGGERGNEEQPRELRLFKVKKERGRLCG